MKDLLDHSTASPGKASKTILRQMNELTGVRASKTGDNEIHVNFNIQYKNTTYCEYFVKIERSLDGTWNVFSHSLPHYLPTGAILRNAPYTNPTKAVEDVHRFLEFLAKRMGQVLQAKARYPTMLKITNTATYNLVRVYFTQETKIDLLRGAWFDLKYTLLSDFPDKVHATLSERISQDLSRQNNKDLQAIIKGFRKYPITTVVRTILED